MLDAASSQLEPLFEARGYPVDSAALVGASRLVEALDSDEADRLGTLACHTQAPLLAELVGRAIVRKLLAAGTEQFTFPPEPTPRPFVRLAEYVVLEEFLALEELDELLVFTVGKETHFETTRVMQADSVSGIVDYRSRKSRVIFDLGRHYAVFCDRILTFLPWVFRRLQLRPFPVGHVEAQLTASNDGEYFKTHSDNAHNALRSRELTFVYYFHCEPKAFTGGELRLYDSRLVNGQYVAEPTFREVAPRQNQIVFFPSYLMHEVRPVSCSSQRLKDSRFTVNGWLHKG